MNSNESNKQPLELVPLDEENNSPAIANFGQKDDGEYIGHDRRFAFYSRRESCDRRDQIRFDLLKDSRRSINNRRNGGWTSESNH